MQKGPQWAAMQRRLKAAKGLKMAANSNNGNGNGGKGISAAYALHALLAQGFIFDFGYKGQGIALHNDADIKIIICNDIISISQALPAMAMPINIASEHFLADCSIKQGKLQFGPACSFCADILA